MNIIYKNMKYFIALAFGATLLFGCGPTNKKAELKTAKEEFAALETKIKTLEKEISASDTTLEEEEIGATVQIATLAKQEFAHTVKVHGVVEASKNIMVNPEVTGKIISISVREGRKISKGQAIASIDASIIRKNIEEVKKGLEFATTIFEKQKSLNEKGVGTEVQFLEAKNRKESAEKSLETLNSQLAKYVVRAPISGYVDDIIPNVGEMASPQMAIARMVNLEKVFVESEISEALLGKVNEGDEVEVSFSNINKTVKGKIVQTGQYIDPMNRTFKIKIDLAEQNSLFKPNLLAVIKITDYKATEAVVVPNKTVQDDIKGNFVFVNENGIASKKYVTLGNSNQTSTEILEGLEGTESIITKGNKGLIKGEKLNIVE